MAFQSSQRAWEWNWLGQCLLCILASGALAMFVYHRGFGGLWPEGLEMAQSARRWASGEGWTTFVLWPGGEAWTGELQRAPDLYGSPFFVFCLTLVFHLFHPSEQWAAATSAAFFVFTAGLVFTAGWRLAGAWGAWAAGLGWMLQPAALRSAWSGTEVTCASFLLVGAMAATLWGRSQLLAGLLWGALILTRPGWMLALPLATILLRRGRRPWLLGLGALMLLGLWGVRNERVAGVPWATLRPAALWFATDLFPGISVLECPPQEWQEIPWRHKVEAVLAKAWRQRWDAWEAMGPGGLWLLLGAAFGGWRSRKRPWAGRWGRFAGMAGLGTGWAAMLLLPTAGMWLPVLAVWAPLAGAGVAEGVEAWQRHYLRSRPEWDFAHRLPWGYALVVLGIFAGPLGGMGAWALLRMEGRPVPLPAAHARPEWVVLTSDARLAAWYGSCPAVSVGLREAAWERWRDHPRVKALWLTPSTGIWELRRSWRLALPPDETWEEGEKGGESVLFLKRAEARAMRYPKTMAPFWRAWGDKALAAGDRGKAEQYYLQATAVPDAEALFRLGIVWQEQGRKEQAEQAYRLALEVERNHVGALNNLAWLLLERGELEEAERWARAALQEAPQDPYVLDTMGWLMNRKGEREAAGKYLREALERAPEELRAPIEEHWRKTEEAGR